MKILSIIGNRPQFVKAFPLNKKLGKIGRHILLHTGQHYDDKLSGVFFKELKLARPDYYLGIGSGTHAYQVGEMTKKIEQILFKEKPDIVIVYGDTNTTLAGALAAAKINVPVAHIEAGMRCGRKIPEEINRILVDHTSSLLFCSTREAVLNLKKEGIGKGVHKVGDLMYDAMIKISPRAGKKTSLLKKNKIQTGKYYFMTIHRAENTEDKQKIKLIFKAVKKIKAKIIFPVHPRTEKLIKKADLKIPENLIIVKPLSYLETIFLVKNSRGVITDSGGLQKEAYFLKIPCFTLRDETEWTETVKSRWNFLVGTDMKKILRAVNNFKKPDRHPLFYGSGNSAEKICNIIAGGIKRKNF